MTILVSYRSLRNFYEIGNTRSRNKCQPRPVKGVSVLRIDFTPADIPIPVPRPVYGYYGQRDQRTGYQPK